MKEAKRMMMRRPTVFRRPANLEAALKSMHSHGVFTAEGQDWKTQRRLTAPCFNQRNVEGMMPEVQRSTRPSSCGPIMTPASSRFVESPGVWSRTGCLG